MLRTPDKMMDIDFGVYCPRCGHDKRYHTKSAIMHIKCIRKSPYILKDGIPAKLGMQVWFADNGMWGVNGIITGMIRFIMKSGYMQLWIYPEDRIKMVRVVNSVQVDISKLQYDNHCEIRRWFGSYENAKKHFETLK